MKKDFDKIVLVCLDEDFAAKVGKFLADSIEMTFCRAKDLLEYELIDVDKLKEFSDIEYLQAQEKKVFAHIASFCDVVVAVSYDSFTENREFFDKKCAVLFLKLAKDEVTDKINLLDYKNRTAKLLKIADSSVEASKKQPLKRVCAMLIEKLGGMV